MLSKRSEGPQRVFLKIIQVLGSFHLGDNLRPTPPSHDEVSLHVLLMVETVDC